MALPRRASTAFRFDDPVRLLVRRRRRDQPDLDVLELVDLRTACGLRHGDREVAAGWAGQCCQLQNVLALRRRRPVRRIRA